MWVEITAWNHQTKNHELGSVTVYYVTVFAKPSQKLLPVVLLRQYEVFFPQLSLSLKLRNHSKVILTMTQLMFTN